MAKRDSEAVELPISAMIDVVFLLLIYFIVTQKEVIPETHLAVNLPAPAGVAAEDEPLKPIEVAILPGGRILFGVGGSGGAPVTLDGLYRKLQTLAESPKNRTAMVFVKAHVKADTGTVVQVLDCFQGLGLTNLNLTPIDGN